MMSTIGKLLKVCRKEAQLKKITLNDVASVINRDISYISKVENNKIKPNFNRMETAKLAQLFRDNLVPESNIEEFEQACQSARIGGKGKVADEESDVLQMIYSTLQEIDRNESEKRGYIKELEIRNNVWHGIHQAIVNFDSGKYTFNETAETLERLDKMESDSGNNIRARILLETSRMLRYLAKVELAETKLSQAVELARESGDEILWAESLKERGDLYRRSNQDKLNSALDDYQKAYEIHEKRKDEYGKAFLEIRIASILLTAGNPRDALPKCERSLKYAQISRDEYLERKSLEYKAWALSMLGDLDTAVNLQLKAHMITVKTNQPPELAKSLTYLAGFYFLCRKLDEAKTSFLNADENIKKLLSNMRDSGQAQELFIRGSIFLGLGSVEIQKQNNLNLARKYLENSIAMTDQLRDQLNKGRALKSLGDLALLDSDIEGARACFTGARSLFQKSGLERDDHYSKWNPYYLSSLNLSCAELEFKLGNHEESLGLAEQARKIAIDFGFEEQLLRSQLWEAKLILTKDSEPNQDRIIELCSTAIKNAIAKGYSLLKISFETTKTILNIANEKSTKIAIQIADALINLQPEMLALASYDDQQRTSIENWTAFLRTSVIEWEAMEKALRIKKKSSK